MTPRREKSTQLTLVEQRRARYGGGRRAAVSEQNQPSTDTVSPKALRMRLAIIVAIAAVVGLTVGLGRGITDGVVALVGTGLAGACFLLLFQPPTESRGNTENSAAIGFGSATGGSGDERPLNRAERRAQAREARRLAKQARKQSDD